MERLRHLISSLSKRCCFSGDYSNTDQEDREAKSSLDITSSQIPVNALRSKSPNLKLIIIESEQMPINQLYSIEPSGLLNSERQSYGDNCVYAGSLHLEGTRVINDIILPEAEQGVGKRHFMIKYSDSPNPAYLIKDLGDGNGTFVRINKPLILKSNYIISFGESHMIIILDNSSPPKLTIRFIDGPKVDQRFKFTQSDSPISIGRMTDCSIKFEDNSLSRYHCKISFKENWVIQDGDGENASTNGTWLFVEEFFEIYHEMILKVGETTFKAELNYNKT